MEFIEIAKTDDIPAGNMKAFVVKGKNIFVANHETPILSTIFQLLSIFCIL